MFRFSLTQMETGSEFESRCELLVPCDMALLLRISELALPFTNAL